MAVDWLERCDALLADTERDLASAVGGSSLCALSKSGDRVDAVKYLEGRFAALRELRREVATVSGDAAQPELLQRWRAQLQLAQEKDMGPDWLAYRTGGVDALQEVADPART